jgi:hypothetical protein
MNLLRKLCVSSLLLAVVGGVVGCSSDDDNGGGSTAKLASCKQVCDKSGACPNAIFTVADCKQLCDAFAQASASCQDALKAESDCQLAQADVCANTGCDAQQSAFNTACSK